MHHTAGMLGKEAFPAWLLTLLLILLLGFLCWKMMQKALQLHAGEEAERAEQCGGQSPTAHRVRVHGVCAKEVLHVATRGGDSCSMHKQDTPARDQRCGVLALLLGAAGHRLGRELHSG